MKEFRKNRLAVLCLLVLLSLYGLALFADFFSPYAYDEEDVEHLWSPPAKIHLIDREHNIFLKPFIYKDSFTIDEYYRRIYREDRTQAVPIRFFVRGFSYKLLGLFKSDIHLFGVADSSKIFILGADSKGRDLFTRILYGARISLSIGLIGVLISYGIGLLLGGIAGYYGGRVDMILMRLVEMIMLVPGFYLMLALRSSFPPNLSSTQVYVLLIVILSFIGWASIARVIRGMALSLRENEFVYAAKSLGLRDLQIIVRHIIPHTFSYAIVTIVLSIPGYILGEAALSMIGLGIQEPQASWGNLLSSAMGIVNIKLFPWILTPGLFIIAASMCFYVLGETLRDIIDPKRKISL